MALSDTSEKPHYLGHRKRLRTRFLQSPAGSLPDYELVEMLLFFSHPRQDVKPLAKQLLTQFGSLSKLLQSDETLLKSFAGVNDSTLATLKLIKEAACRLVKEDTTQLPVLQSWKAVVDYCRATMGHLTTEQFRVLFLNKQNMLIADEVLAEGTLDQVTIYPREVIKRALYFDAAALILVHNHPSGDTRPSAADIAFTHHLQRAATAIGIELHDHIIISRSSHYSFKNQCLL